jgi:sulfatase maturation enzyme AslB (radical SAM superfamily)
VHFAGGEPLIMAEHYQVLDLLIKHQRTDVPLSYNSNFTVLTYKNFNIIEYWKQFSTVIFRASIDLIGKQAGYVRHGTNYDDIEKNYSLVKDYVDFEINSIVHMLNIFNLPKLQHRWITVHQLPAKALSFRIMIIPDNMNVQVLPKKYKDQAEKYILDHINWLESISDAEHLVSSWKDVLQYMYACDQSHLLGNFFKSNDMQDTYRCEKFEEVFPEYINLRSYV